MRRLTNVMPYLVALIPQIVFHNYTFVLLSTILIGFISGWTLTIKGVFMKMAIVQLAFYSLLFLTNKSNIEYLNDVLGNFGLSSYLLPFLFIIFNTLNISFLFLLGRKIQKLLYSNLSF